jgi:hypothetical protein
MELTREIAIKVLGIVDHGLSHGLGTPEPGKLCVEAAVCLALGLPHGDNPPCVGYAVRSFKIRLNDSKWSSPEARAIGMRRLAIAQLGSDQVDQKEFVRLLAEENNQADWTYRLAGCGECSERYLARNGAGDCCVAL